MLDEFDNKLLVERLKRRIEQANTYFLMKIGSYIKQIKNLNPSKAQQLIQMLKYGGNFEEIIKKLAEYTGMNVADINDIFSNYAKKDQYFYEKFYEYRNIPFIPFDQNSALKMQTRALSNIAANEMYDFTRANVLGYTINDKFYNLRDTYNELLDTAFLNVGQGKETFDSAMKHILEDIGGSGLKTINYASGRAVRLDSVIEMHLNSRLRELHNENQKIIGEEIGSDGVEISVHMNPAPDHELAQGRQFSNEEFEKLNNGQDAIDYKGRTITLDHDHKNGYRPISEMNCYHYIFSIVLGVSEPNYTDKELKQIIDDNNKGFEFEGKHYTNYEGTQLQRRLEREVRKQKDIQILARESDNQELIASSQDKITKLTRKYKEFSKQSGLTPYMENMRVSGYRRVKQVGTSQLKTNVELLKHAPEKPSFEKYRNMLDKMETKDIANNFDFKGFTDEYNKFYNTLDKKEVSKTYDDYKEWIKTDMETSHPIGEYLNKKFEYDKKPELMDEKDYFIDEDGEPVLTYHDTTVLDENHWFRGVDSKNIEDIKKYTDEFKEGKFFAGKGINGNGTYATTSYGYASSFGDDDKGGIIYLMPKENAKIIDIDKIVSIRSKLIRYINSDDELYINFTTTVLDDNGYLAQLLGYDIVNLGTHKLILNRGSIKVVK